MPVAGLTSSLTSLIGNHGLYAVFLLSAVSIGVFVATVTNTLQQAMLTAFFSLFPLLFLSGTVTPIESMPVWLQAAVQASPLRHVTQITTSLFLKGAGVRELWPHAAAGDVLHRRVVIIAHPDGCDDIGRKADEPGIAAAL